MNAAWTDEDAAGAADIVAHAAADEGVQVRVGLKKTSPSLLVRMTVLPARVPDVDTDDTGSLPTQRRQLSDWNRARSHRPISRLHSQKRKRSRHCELAK